MAGKGKGKKDSKQSKKKDTKGKDTKGKDTKGKDTKEKDKKKAGQTDTETTGSKSTVKEAPQLSNIKTGADFFSFPSGDTYLGGFEATIEKTIHRQGKGIYVTSDEHLYRGDWDKDILNGEVHITYGDKSSYYGNMQEFKYNGEGKYMFPNTAEMSCEFVNNIPVNEVLVIDPAGHLWHGKTERGSVLMKPMNHFLSAVKQRIADIQKENEEKIAISKEALPSLQNIVTSTTNDIKESKSVQSKTSPKTLTSEQEEVELASSDLESISTGKPDSSTDTEIKAKKKVTPKKKPKKSKK